MPMDRERRPPSPESLTNSAAMKNATDRLKRFSGWIAVLCILVGPSFTTFSMIRSFQSTIETNKALSTDELANDVEFALNITASLLPVAIIAGLIWVACRYRISRAK